MSSNYILDADELRDVVKYFEQYDAFAWDIESMGEHRGESTKNQVVWLSMATHGKAVAIPFGHPNGSHVISKATRKKNKVTGKFDMIPAVFSAPPKQMRPSQVFDIVRPLFFSDRYKSGHGLIFDVVSVVKYFGEVPPPPYDDTIIMQHLLNENLMKKGLKDLVKKYYKVDYDKENVGKCIEAHTFKKVAHYSFMDARYSWFLRQELRPRLERQGLMKLYEDLEMEIFDVLIDMRLEGAPVDVDRIVSLESELADRLEVIEGRIYQAAGKRFNINSNPQKQKILYDPKILGGQGLKPKKMTKGGAPSCDDDALSYYPNNPVVAALRDYADVSKLLNTYIRGYLGVEDDKDRPCRIFDGRIHADFVQYGTVTGRFSCREPNLQNIPRPDTELGKEIRGLFIAPPGHKLVVADYGQIEMVLLAHYLGQGRLYDGFMAGHDPHTATAAGVFGVSIEEVTKAQRQAAKGINFAVVYGAGPDKVAAMAGTSVEEAKKFLDQHQKMFPEIYRFKDAVLRECRKRKPPHLTTLLGRKRRLPTLLSQDRALRGYAERQAVNSLIQGSAADLIKLAMVRLNKALPEDMRLILSVHDELVTIVPENRAAYGAEIVKEAMLGQGIQKLVRVPLSSDVKTVDRWSEAK